MLAAALLAFGEHKGSGMSMLIELTAGLVSKMGTSVDPDYQGGNGTLIMALDIMAFTELDRYFEQAEVFAHEAKRVGGARLGQMSSSRASSKRGRSRLVGLEAFSWLPRSVAR